MREIKFRAWDKEEKRIFVPDAINFKEKIVYEVVEIGTRKYPFSRIELIEYTGFKDKNGKEIYEGDIAECIVISESEFSDDEYIEIIKDIFWHDEYCVFYADREMEYRIDEMEGIEIIGNIYENPKLLEANDT